MKTANPSLCLIFAMDQNQLIGSNNALPWRLPADLKYFKRKTTGHPVLMGRKTHQSIGKPLPDRTNIILTRDPSFKAEGCTVVHTVKDAIQFAATQAEHQEIMVMGGAEIYKQTLPYANKLLITKIDHAFEGDTYFPDFSADEWQLVEEEIGTVDEKNQYPHRFLEYKRIAGGISS